MNTETTTLEKLIDATKEYGLVPSEYLKDNDYIENMLVNGSDFRSLLAMSDIDLAYYHELNESETSDYWNELRLGNIVVDTDAPEELTVEEWAEYLDRMINLV